MSTDKVKFQLDVKEENKEFSYILIAVFLGLILISLVSIVVSSFNRGEQEAQRIAGQWAQAELQSNDSMKYILLSENVKNKFMEEYANTKNREKITYDFEEYDLIQWKKSKHEYIFKFHYYGMKTCSDCQKDVWVRVIATDQKWVVPDFQFSEGKADKLIKGLEAEKIPTSSEQEGKLEQKKTMIREFFQSFM